MESSMGRMGASAQGRSDLGSRAVTAVLALPVLLGVALVFSWGSAALLGLAAVLCAWELGTLLQMARVRRGEERPCPPREGMWKGTPLLAALLGGGVYAAWAFLPLGWPLLACGGVLAAVAVSSGRLLYGARAWRAAAHVKALCGALVWAVVPLALLGGALQASPQRLGWLALALSATWLGDMGAYFVGRRWGRRKLAPQLSPNKTVEGALGGALVAALLGAAVAWLWLPGLSPLAGAAVALLASVLGQAGDLWASSLKRSRKVKDSGHLLPGYGGALDKFDSMLAAAPWLALCITLWR